MATATEVKTRPIMFSDPMVTAILEGRKTQTRRVVKPQPIWHPESHVKFAEPGKFYVCPDALPTTRDVGLVIAHCEARGVTRHMGQQAFIQDFCPYGTPGDRLWVREAWRTWERPADCVDGILFRVNHGEFYPIEDTREAADRWVEAHDNGRYGEKWRSRLFMPRWASRITLEITRVRVERVQDISEADAIAEGCQSHYCSPEDTASCAPGTPERALAEVLEGGFLTAKHDFIERWRWINGKRPRCAWTDNPWVWAIDFKRVRA